MSNKVQYILSSIFFFIVSGVMAYCYFSGLIKNGVTFTGFIVSLFVAILYIKNAFDR